MVQLLDGTPRTVLLLGLLLVVVRVIVVLTLLSRQVEVIIIFIRNVESKHLLGWLLLLLLRRVSFEDV